MLITKQFVLLNFPKTGSSFTRKVIKEIYDKRVKNDVFLKTGLRFKLIQYPYKELLLPKYEFQISGEIYLDQHGTYSQIPKQYRKRQIVSIIRNPYERLISFYEYRFWADKPLINLEIIKSKLPNFPNISLDEYIDYLRLVNEHLLFKGKKKIEVGLMTTQFIKFFFKEPDLVLNNLNEEYLKSEVLFKNDMAKIHFLRQEHLKTDLIQFLKKFEFSESEIDFINDHDDVNITKNKAIDRSRLYSDKVVRYMEEEEFFLFWMLKNIGILYRKPETYVN